VPNAFERFSERLENRAKLGGRSIYETRLRLKEWTGPGGKKLKESEKRELFRRAVEDSSGQMFQEVLTNRQAANGLEGTTGVPADWWVWAKSEYAKLQQEGGE